MLTDQAILSHIERQPHRSAGFKQLVREMGLRGSERQQLAERLQALVKSARLIETGRDRYTLAEHAAANQNLLAGRLTMHRDGYGFVIPNAGQRSTFTGGIDLENLRTALTQASVNAAKGNFDGPRQDYQIDANDQLVTSDDYRK